MYGSSCLRLAACAFCLVAAPHVSRRPSEDESARSRAAAARRRLFDFNGAAERAEHCPKQPGCRCVAIRDNGRDSCRDEVESFGTKKRCKAKGEQANLDTVWCKNFVFPTEQPTAACVDAALWTIEHNGKMKDCSWVGKQPDDRCEMGSGQSKAKKHCLESCGECEAGAAPTDAPMDTPTEAPTAKCNEAGDCCDSASWSRNGDPKRTCDWVASNTAVRCTDTANGDTSEINALTQCQVTCGTCPTDAPTETPSETPTETPTDAPTDAPTDIPCEDSPPGWVSLTGATCQQYETDLLCTPDGEYGSGWKRGEMGEFSDWAVDGVDASRACCACGGGTTGPTATPTTATPTEIDYSDFTCYAWNGGSCDHCLYQKSVDAGAGRGCKTTFWGSDQARCEARMLSDATYDATAWCGPRTWSQVAKLTSADATAYDFFGFSVAVSGDHAVVGAYGDDDIGPLAGSAYLFRKTDGAWSQVAKFLPEARPEFQPWKGGHQFGRSVAISRDYAVVGARFSRAFDYDAASGVVYVYGISSSTSSEVYKLAAFDHPLDYLQTWFGDAVAIDGEHALFRGGHQTARRLEYAVSFCAAGTERACVPEHLGEILAKFGNAPTLVVAQDLRRPCVASAGLSDPRGENGDPAVGYRAGARRGPLRQSPRAGYGASLRLQPTLR